MQRLSVLASRLAARWRRRPASVVDQVALDTARRYRHVYYAAPVALLSCDAQGRLLRWNDRAQALFGERLQRGRVNLLSSALGQPVTDALVAALSREPRWTTEFEIAPDGGDEADARVCALEAHTVGDAIELSVVDVSERTRLARTLEHIAHHDFLTNLLNRRGVERELERLLEHLPEGAHASIVYVDLDRFKAINDVFGHAAGDAVVIEVARRLREAAPDDAAVARLGGDEFLVVLPGQRLEAAQAVAVRLRRALTGHSYAFEGTMFDVDASFGVTEASGAMQVRELIAFADLACSRSKRSGRERVTVLRADHEALAEYRAEIWYGTQLKSGLPIDRMLLYAQPVVPLLDERAAMGYEVLLRVRGDDGAIEGPARLIAAAERHGEMPAVDRHVLQAALAHLGEHEAFACSLDFLTVNLSGMSLNHERFRRDAVAMLRAHPRVAARVCLEITESVALFDVSSTRRFIDDMRALGVRIALDDFGAGYTSFAYLKELPASLLKIDGQFVSNLCAEPRHRGVIRAIRELGLQFGMRCVAEWVEDVPTVRALIELQVDYAQGYAFSRPRPLETWLRESPDLGALVQARDAGERAPSVVQAVASQAVASPPAASHALATQPCASPPVIARRADATLGSDA